MKKKAKILGLERRTARARNAEMTRQRKGKAKEIDPGAWLKRDKYSRRTGKVFLEGKIVPRVFDYKRKIVVMIESVIIGISRIANFKKAKCQLGMDCLFIHSQKKNRSTSLKGEKVKEKSPKR